MRTTEQDFTYLIEKHKSVIYTVCLMFSKYRTEIDDMFQEILIKLWNGYEKFRGKSDVKTWIYRAIILLWLEGMTYEEIGAIIGISVKNVSFQLSRIREELKKINN